MGNSNIERINIKTNLQRNSQNEIKSRNDNLEQKKNKYVKRDINKLTNLYDINQDNTQKVNYYLNEINQKKTIEADSTKNNKNTIDSEYRKNNNEFNLKRMIDNDVNKKPMNNTEIMENDNVKNKNISGLENNCVITNNSSLNNLGNTQNTESGNLNIKQKIIKKENPKYNYIERPDKKYYIYKKIRINSNNRNTKNSKKQNNFISRNLNKTSHNFNISQINSNHKNIFDITNPSSSSNTHRNMNKKNNNYRKKSQVTNIHNKKKPFVTIKNTVINFNIETGFILAPIDKKNK